MTGTILDRNVEKGEFVTTGFVGDKGAKGYIVTMADLNDLKVELDISQNDFPKLDRDQKGMVTTDAYPDRKYQGMIDEISPEADRSKATVQVKVKVLNPDDRLRPDMNATVNFYNEAKASSGGQLRRKRVVVVPPSARTKRICFRGVERKGEESSGDSRWNEPAQGSNDRKRANWRRRTDCQIAPADMKDGQRVRSAAAIRVGEECHGRNDHSYPQV